MKDNRPAKTVTITDIARETGTSVATVSRVLSGSDYPVSQPTRERVLEAARRMNYTPNLLGRMLKTNSNATIGVILFTLQNPFFNQVLIGIEAEARKRNLEILFYSSHRNEELERQYIASMLQKRVMGMVLFSVDQDPECVNRYIQSGGRVALMEGNFNVDGAINIHMDYQQSGQMAAAHLADMGHRKIAFLTAPLTRRSRLQVLEGCRLALEQRSIAFDDEDIIISEGEQELSEGLFEFENGRKLAGSFLQRRSEKGYTAIIAINDITAFGIIQELSQQGVAVPEEVSVIGFDNIEYSAMITPPLTTVEQPSTSMGQTVCRLLIDSMENAQQDIELSVAFHPRLVVRKSVKDLRA